MEVDNSQESLFEAEVAQRFGVLPNFFCTASSAPGLMEKMWAFAKSGYLDNPLPSLFKERLFVHLSRFCATRYCMVRHVGFLIGEGRPAGDPNATPHSIEQVVRLLTRPATSAEKFELAFVGLEALPPSDALPDAETQLERDLFDALTVLFVAPLRAARARGAITSAFGEMTFELLAAFLAFVRTAHYWTETHPTLAFEADMLAIMRQHPELARLMLDSSDAEWAQSSDALKRALADLQTTTGTLRDSEERFKALVTATSNVIYRMSPDWSEVWQIQGQGFISDSTGSSRDWLKDYVHPDDHSQVSAAIAEAVNAKRLFELEHRVKRVDGTPGWILSRAVPLMDGGGNIVEWFGTARDISVRRNAEEALRDGDRRKNEFLATLAHELRNPLAPLRNGLHIAKAESMPGTLLRRTIEMMDRQLTHLVHLVNDLMDVGRISSGKVELRQERVSLRKVLAASVEACRSAIDGRGHALTVKAGAEDLFVEGDFERLSQVLSNLLSNAAKYTEPGGRIDVEMFQEADEAVVTVSDTGIGIPAAELPRVFELFSQVPEHRDRADGGLGIGLSLVRKLVEMHRGSVAAMSPGSTGGSTFTLRLPLMDAVHAGRAPQIPQRSPIS